MKRGLYYAPGDGGGVEVCRLRLSSTCACVQLEDEHRGRDDVREQMAMSERRAMVIAGELEELRTQLEAAERARKAAEAELHETSDRVSELAGSNNSLVTAKRKLEIDIQAMQVYGLGIVAPPPRVVQCAAKTCATTSLNV